MLEKHITSKIQSAYTLPFNKVEQYLATITSPEQNAFIQPQQHIEQF